MRRIASIPALLALTGLSLLAPAALARPHRHISPPAQHKSHHKSAPKPSAKAGRKSRRKHPRALEADAPDPITVNRIHAWVKKNTSLPPARPTALGPAKPDVLPHKATSEDFLAAAQAPANSAVSTVRPAITGTSAPSDDAIGTALPASETRTRRVAKTPIPVPVPSPQLEVPDALAPAARPQALAEPPAPVILPSLYNERGRLVMPRALKGSHDILLRQNQVADSDGLSRIQDDDDLEQMRRERLLIALPVNEGLQVDDRLPANRRYCRPWTAQFLVALARAHYARFHTPLQVNSAVRTVAFQLRLKRSNGNAAPADGDTASPHLTGQTVDLAKKGLSLTEIAWMRGYLLPFVQEGKVDVEEEFRQSCFHISVYKKYQPAETLKRFASTHRASTAALAAILP